MLCTFEKLCRKFRRRAANSICVLLVAGAFASVFFAQSAAAGAPTPTPTPTPTDPPGTTNWGGLGWGIGVAADFAISEAIGLPTHPIVNGLVRVNDTSGNVGVGFVLEAHYFFRDWLIPSLANGCTAAQVSAYSFVCTDAAVGPFVTIEVGGGSSATPAANGPITAFALGAMVGFRHLDPTKVADNKTTSSWNFGIGLRVDPRAQVLGDGFIANQPPPPGETAIRYRTEPRYGIMLLSSFSF